MSDLFHAIEHMPIHHILGLCGVIMIVAAILGELEGKFRLPSVWQRVALAGFGILLITYFFQIDSKLPPKAPTGELASPKDSVKVTSPKSASNNDRKQPAHSAPSRATKKPTLPPEKNKLTATSTTKSYPVSGQIKSEETAQGLEDVEIHIGNQMVKTDKSGFFKLTVQGSYGERKKIVIQKQGYASIEYLINIPKETISENLIKLDL